MSHSIKSIQDRIQNYQAYEVRKISTFKWKDNRHWYQKDIDVKIIWDFKAAIKQMLQEATANTLGKNVKIESLSQETQSIKRSQKVILELKNAIVSELEHRLIEIIQPKKRGGWVEEWTKYQEELWEIYKSMTTSLIFVSSKVPEGQQKL